MGTGGERELKAQGPEHMLSPVLSSEKPKGIGFALTVLTV
jgi:hypothetical protein